MTLTNKIALITGGSRGIGAACAQLFAEQGATVVVHYNANKTAADDVLALLAGDDHSSVQADVGDPEAVKAMVEAVIAQHGRVDVLVNNAGVYADHALEDVDYETWQQQWAWTLNVNLLGAANASFLVARHMIAAGIKGRIVNVSSRGAFRGEPTAPAYGASKAGMNSMGQSLAKYLAPHGIGVYTVAPGWVETDMARDYLDTGVAQQSPLNRVARPAEIAAAVAFFASADVEFATGAVLDVNGASYLRT